MRGFSKKRVTAWFLMTMLILSTFGGLSHPAAASGKVDTQPAKWMSNGPFAADSQGLVASEPQQITQQTAVGAFPQNLTDWVLDQDTGMIYAISDSTNTLYFIEKQTLTIKKELQLSGAPTDMYKFGNKLYISQVNNLIQPVDLTTKSLDEPYLTPSYIVPTDVAVSATHIFFVSNGNYVYSMDRTTKEIKFNNNVRMSWKVDLQVGSDNRTLYLADRGSSSSKFYSYDTVADKIINVANDGFSNPTEEIILDEQSAYFAGYRMNKNDISDFLGEYQWQGANPNYLKTKILSVSSNYVLTTQGIFTKNTYLNVATLPIDPTQGILDEDGSVYLFKSETTAANNKMYRYSITVNSEPKVQMNKVGNTLESNFTITDWATTEDTPYIYAISETANAITVIRKSDFSTVKSVWIGSRPVDVEINSGKVYVALRGTTYIAQFNIADTENSNLVIEKRRVTGLPVKIEPYKGKIFYTIYSDSDRIKVLSETNEHSQLPFSSWFYDLDAKEEALYVLGSIDHKKFDANTLSTLQSGSYHIGVRYDKDDLLKDGDFLYFHSSRLSATDLSTFYGTYPEAILYAKDKLVFGSRAVYDRDTFSKITDLPMIISKAYVADDRSILLSSENKLAKYANLNEMDRNNVTPKQALFVDDDPHEGIISGYIYIQPGENAQAVQSYNAYFMDSSGYKFFKLNTAFVSQENGILKYRIKSTYSTPSESTKIAIFPVLSGGVENSQYITTEIWDTPSYFAKNISVTNSEFAETGFSGTVTWDRATRQPTNTFYQIYFMDVEGPIGDPIKTVPANQYYYSVNFKNVPIPAGTIGLGITLINSKGETPPYISGVIFEELFSPAPLPENITITNSVSSNDTVTVTGLTAGDIIRVYNEAETTLLGQGTVAEGQTSVTISIPNIGIAGQKVSVTRETIELYESAGTLVVIPVPESPPVVTPPGGDPTPTDPPPTPPPGDPSPAPAPPQTVHIITVTTGEHGTISPSGSVEVVEGTNQTFTITPEKGYEIDKLLVDGAEASAPNNKYTLTNVKAKHTINVTFKVAKDTTAPWAPDVNEVTDMATTITGTAEEGAKVTAKVGAKVIGTAVASANGDFKMTIAKQAAGTIILVTATDAANNVSEATKVVVKDVTAPAAPRVNVVTDIVGKVTGKAEAGATVTVSVGTKVVGKAVVDKNGNFTVVIAKQKAGTVLKVVVVDRSMNISKPTNITVIDKTPPAKPVVNSVTSGSTNVTGKAEVGSTVIVKVGSKVIGTTVAGKDGKFSVKIVKQKVKVVLSVTAKDKSGNESVAVKVTVKK